MQWRNVMRESTAWRTCRRVSLGLLALGIALLVMMIRMEDEFGALPLLLILLGLIGYGTAWFKTRR